MEMHGKSVLILGLAREGVSLARFCLRQGARVTVSDTASAHLLAAQQAAIGSDSVHYALGGDDPDIVRQQDLFFVSPGIPEKNQVYRAAIAAGLQPMSMTTLFFDRCPAPIVGITGSSGKTTTTSLIGHILAQAGLDSVVGGNIGDPMLDLLPRINPETRVVLELSSFQLSLLHASPHIAVVTNISPNHLDRHGTMREYVSAKLNIVRHQRHDDIAVLNADDEYSGLFASTTSGTTQYFGTGRDAQATVRDRQVVVDGAGAETRVMPVSDIPLLGRHNVENVLAASAVARILDVPVSTIATAVRSYRPAPHRLQPVGHHAGVQYIDDSIATSPARSIVALNAIDAPIHLIAGGRDKDLPWREFARVAVQKVRALYLIGEAAQMIEDAVRNEILAGQTLLQPEALVRCGSLMQAVEMAGRAAVARDVVLLSPACASYDMFTDFRERGTMFAGAVARLDAA